MSAAELRVPWLVQVTFALGMPSAAYLAHAQSVVHEFAAVSGLVWKVWWLDDETNHAGGVYLFRSERDAQAYCSGPIVASLRASPGICDLSIRAAPVAQSLSAVTGPPAFAA